MKTLPDVLMQYTEENLVTRFLRETAGKTRLAQQKADVLTGRLNALSPEAEQWLEELKSQWDEMNDGHETALLLSGISIGLELGRL